MSLHGSKFNADICAFASPIILRAYSPIQILQSLKIEFWPHASAVAVAYPLLLHSLKMTP